MKYLIFGKNGWLAKKFEDFLGNALVSDVDITDLEAIRKELGEKKPEVVINAAGMTGRPNIDWCEDHKMETVSVNVTGALNILQACLPVGRACEENKIYWVHLGSGCIFQGDSPNNEGWKEDDEATPPSFYSWTKYWADSILKHFPVLIVRLRLPIDIEPNPRNLIDKLLKYDKVINTENSVTVIPDLLDATKKLIDKRKTGIYHITNPGVLRPSEVMQLYKDVIDSYHDFEVVSAEHLYKNGLVKAVRSNCVLNTDKLQKEGIILKPIQKRIKEVIKEYKKNL